MINKLELFKNPGCIGFHLCGAYQRNKSRARGLLDEFENPDTENIRIIQKTNEKLDMLTGKILYYKKNR